MGLLGLQDKLKPAAVAAIARFCGLGLKTVMWLLGLFQLWGALPLWGVRIERQSWAPGKKG